MASPVEEGPAARRFGARRISPLSAAGGLLIAVTATALITYAILTVPGRLRAAGGPPEAFLQAATQQQAGAIEAPALVTPPGIASASTAAPADGAVSAAGPTSTLLVARPAVTATPTPDPDAEPSGGAIPAWVEEDYWISIPRIELEAPVMGFALRQQEVDGVTVERLPVPNTYAIGWDSTSAAPGFAGNTIVTGHNNLFGAVFGRLDELQAGDTISVWSDLGVFEYTVSQVVLLEEKDQPIEVRRQNATWLNDTPEDRLTLITCWPRNTYTHRLIVIAVR